MGKKKNSKEELQRYLDLCIKLGRRLTKKEMSNNKFTYEILNRCLKDEGYNDLNEFLYKNNIINEIIPKPSIESVIESYKRFYKENNRLPVVKDNSKNDYLYSREVVKNILSKNSMTLLDLCELVAGKDNVDMNYKILIGLESNEDMYNLYKNKFIEACKNNNNRPINKEGICEKFNIPNVKWFINNCPDKNVKTYEDFCEWCGFIRPENITKEKAIKIIFNMQSKLDRPLMYDDFRNPKYGEISISTVKRYWGTMNKMKEELGLEIIQDDMICKHVDDISVYINDLHNICDVVYNNFNRKTINCHDIEKYTKLNMTSSSIRQNIRKISNLSIKSIIEGYNGFSYQREGCGIVNRFNDGETTKSKYEYIFSINLRDMGLSYNIDYKRDIKYRDFIKNYNGLLDCDYVIYVDNREIYIEIAGMLNGKEINYINNIPINETTNRKEKYRLKLMEKEQMLKNNNLEYYIIFPSDFNNINKLFNKLKLNK